jgi:signal peptidase I
MIEAASESSEPASDEPQEPEASSSRKDDKEQKRKRPFWQESIILVVMVLVINFIMQTFIARPFVIPSESMEPTLHGCFGCTGDRVLVDRMVYRFDDPRPGDVVVFVAPPNWQHEVPESRQSKKDDSVVGKAMDGLKWLGRLVRLLPPDENYIVKRVIATGGQTVACDPQHGLTVDGKPLDEPYLAVRSPYLGNHSMDDLKAENPCLSPDVRFERFGPFTVPQGKLWVMGDNRTDSNDSRGHLYSRHFGDQPNVDLATVPVGNVVGKVRLIIYPASRWGVVHAPQIQH